MCARVCDWCLFVCLSELREKEDEERKERRAGGDEAKREERGAREEETTAERNRSVPTTKPNMSSNKNPETATCVNVIKSEQKAPKAVPAWEERDGSIILQEFSQSSMAWRRLRLGRTVRSLSTALESGAEYGWLSASQRSNHCATRWAPKE